MVKKGLEKFLVNLKKRNMNEEDIVNIVSMFGLKINRLRVTEAMLFSCNNMYDTSLFKFERFY